MSLLVGKRKSICIIERKAKRHITKSLKKEIIFSKRLYKLGEKFFDLLPHGYKPGDNQQLVTLILLARGLEHLRAIQHLLQIGYLSESASLAANAIEIFLQLRKLKTNTQAADEWLNHTEDRSCWPITGQRGLCTKLQQQKIEAHYKFLCTIKHTQSKTKHLNFCNNGYKQSIVMAPIFDIQKIQQVLLYADGAVERIITDAAEILKTNVDLCAFKKWKRKADILNREAVKYYKNVKMCRSKKCHPAKI